MTDRKSLAIILGAVVGMSAVAITAAVLMSRNHEPATHDVNEVVDKARQTVKKLDEAIDLLRKSAA